MARADGPEVRAATTGDIETIPVIGRAAGERFRSIDVLSIAARADDPPYTAEEVRAWGESEGALVADLGGEVVGFALVEELDDAAHVEELSVRPDQQGTGLGTVLLDAAARWAAARGLAGVTLTTYRDVPWNCPFYERRGFRVLADDELTDGMRAKIAHEPASASTPPSAVVMRRPL